MNGGTQLRVAYHGLLSGPDLRLHYGFDGWQEPIQETKLEQVEPSLAMTEPLELANHITLDCVVTDGNQWDNTYEACPSSHLEHPRDGLDKAAVSLRNRPPSRPRQVEVFREKHLHEERIGQGLGQASPEELAQVIRGL